MPFRGLNTWLGVDQLKNPGPIWACVPVSMLYRLEFVKALKVSEGVDHEGKASMRNIPTWLKRKTPST